MSRENTVAEFHKAFGHKVGGPITQDDLTLRYGLLFEEFEEVKEEIAAALADISLRGEVSAKTKSRLLKELADLQYVLSGMAVSFDLPLQSAFNLVHKSNMSKLGRDGKPIYREDGKILKGPDYSPPDLEYLVELTNLPSVPGYDYY